MVNYERWAQMVDSDDETPPEDSTPATDFGRQLMASWLREATPDLTASEVTLLTKFCEVQQPRLGESDNRTRATDIVQFCESNGGVPRVEPLVNVVACSLVRSISTLDEAARAPALRVRAVLTSALNTACACRQHGGARPLFELMRSSPDGEIAQFYGRQGYASAEINAHSERALQRAANASAKGAHTLPGAVTGRSARVDRSASSCAACLLLVALAGAGLALWLGRA